MHWGITHQETRWHSCSIEVDYYFWFFLSLLGKQASKQMVVATGQEDAVNGWSPQNFFSNV